MEGAKKGIEEHAGRLRIPNWNILESLPLLSMSRDNEHPGRVTFPTRNSCNSSLRYPIRPFYMGLTYNNGYDGTWSISLLTGPVPRSRLPLLHLFLRPPTPRFNLSFYLGAARIRFVLVSDRSIPSGSLVSSRIRISRVRRRFQQRGINVKKS